MAIWKMIITSLPIYSLWFFCLWGHFRGKITPDISHRNILSLGVIGLTLRCTKTFKEPWKSQFKIQPLVYREVFWSWRKEEYYLLHWSRNKITAKYVTELKSSSLTKMLGILNVGMEYLMEYSSTCITWMNQTISCLLYKYMVRKIDLERRKIVPVRNIVLGR